MLLAQISLILFCHSSLSFIAFKRSSRLHPMSVQSSWRYVLLGWPTLARLCDRIPRRTSLMSSSLLLQQCLSCLVRLIWMALEIGGRWPYNYCFTGCCFEDLFRIAHRILVRFLFSFFSICFISIHVVHPYCKIDTTPDCVLFYWMG